MKVSTTENSIAVGSLKWFYREAQPQQESEQPPVVFLHGIPGHSFTWCEIMPKLAEKGIRAIAPDWLGFGFSDKPDRREFKYTPDAYVEGLTAFLSALEIESCFLVVQGFLASAGLQYALRNPEAIARLVILNTPMSKTAKLPWKMKQWGLPFAGDMLTQDPLLVDRTLESGSGFQISDRDLAVFRKPFLQSSGAGRSLKMAIENLKLSSAMTEIESGLSNWEKPTLIVWGMADPWLDSDAAENLAQNNSNLELIKLAEAKHYPQEHWQEEITSYLITFLRRQT